MKIRESEEKELFIPKMFLENKKIFVGGEGKGGCWLIKQTIGQTNKLCISCRLCHSYYMLSWSRSHHTPQVWE